MMNCNGENLIFIISQPRAGSTLLQLLLAGHPDIATTSEPWIALHPIYAFKEKGVASDYDSYYARLALEEFLRLSGMDLTFYKKQVSAFLHSLYNKAAENQGRRVFLDKTPRYYFIIDELVELFPKAKFIILLRNPMAVLNSILKTWVKENPFSLSWYKHDLLTAPITLTASLKKYQNNCFKVRYEDLIIDPERILKEICAFLNLPYFKEMLDYSNRLNPDWKFGDPIGVYNASKPTPSSLNSWKKGFNTPQAKLFARTYFELLGRELIEELGYDFFEIKEHLDSFGVISDSGLIAWGKAMDIESLKILTLQAEKEAILGSFSWKITSPLRAIFGFFK